MANLTISTFTPIEILDQESLYSAETFVAGKYVRINTAGKVVLGNASSASESLRGGLAAVEVTTAGEPVTVFKEGYADVGEALAALNIGDPIYLSDTDGTLATTAGTVVRMIGSVVAGWASGATADKLLYFNFKQKNEGY